MKPQIISKLFITSILLILLSSKSFSQATLVVHEDPRISDLLKLQKNLEKENKLSIVFTIQLYYGELDKANDIIKKYQRSYSNWPASIEYETPNWKVWAGSFTSRLEAERALKEIQRDFSSAFILKPERRK